MIFRRSDFFFYLHFLFVTIACPGNIHICTNRHMAILIAVVMRYQVFICIDFALRSYVHCWRVKHFSSFYKEGSVRLLTNIFKTSVSHAHLVCRISRTQGDAYLDKV